MAVNYFKKPFFLAVLICIFVFYSGFFKIPQRNQFGSLFKTNEIKVIKGTILSTPVRISSKKYYNCTFSVQNVENSKGEKSSAVGNLQVYIPSLMVESYFPGKLFSHSYKKGAYLYEAGADYIFEGKISKGCFYVNSCSLCKFSDSFFGKIDYFRALCRIVFKRLMYSWGEGGGLLLALLSGAKEYTSEECSLAFRNAGLSHILALSGMHLSMFSAIALFLGNIVGRKKLTYLIRLVAIILFVWFAGFSPSLLRAFICAFLSLISAMNGNSKTDLIMILSFSFLLQSVISPSDINNIGFMLSYGALAGILLTSEFFRFIFSKILPDFLSKSFSASTSAQLFTAPLSLKVFGTYSPIGIIATTVISPLITIFIYTGLVFIILSLIIPPLEVPSGIFINLQYTIIKNLVIIFSKAPQWSM